MRGDEPASVFEPQPADGKHKAFHYLDPHYTTDRDDEFTAADNREMERISRLYAGFVFRKVGGKAAWCFRV